MRDDATSVSIQANGAKVKIKVDSATWMDTLQLAVQALIAHYPYLTPKHITEQMNEEYGYLLEESENEENDTDIDSADDGVTDDDGVRVSTGTGEGQAVS